MDSETQFGDCWTLKHKIQDLIEAEIIFIDLRKMSLMMTLVMQPNYVHPDYCSGLIHKNPLVSYGAVKPSINMIICDSDFDSSRMIIPINLCSYLFTIQWRKASIDCTDWL